MDRYSMILEEHYEKKVIPKYKNIIKDMIALLEANNTVTYYSTTEKKSKKY